MGLGEKSNKLYLKVSLGAIRKTTTKDDPKAKVRQNKDGENVYERVYNFIDGQLENITFYEHEEFGNSWTLHLKDGEEHYGLQVQENSRYGIDLLKKLPNLIRGERYKIIAYDFEKDGQRRVGLSIEELKTNSKIQSYYQKVEKDGDKLKITQLHGFPEFDGDWKDKDDTKIYFTKVTKFLRKKALDIINGWTAKPDLPEEVTEDKDDLPF